MQHSVHSCRTTVPHGQAFQSSPSPLEANCPKDLNKPAISSLPRGEPLPCLISASSPPELLLSQTEIIACIGELRLTVLLLLFCFAIACILPTKLKRLFCFLLSLSWRGPVLGSAFACTRGRLQNKSRRSELCASQRLDRLLPTKDKVAGSRYCQIITGSCSILAHHGSNLLPRQDRCEIE